MANQIPKDKQQFCLIIEKKLIKQIEDECARTGLDCTETIVKAVNEHLRLDAVAVSAAQVNEIKEETKALRDALTELAWAVREGAPTLNNTDVVMQKFTSEKDFRVTDREKGRVKYIGAGGDVVVPPMVDGCVVRELCCCHINLTTLDVSHNPELCELWCINTNLTTLDLSHTPVLRWLYCINNNLTTIDLTHNPELWQLECGDNNLETLDLSHNPELILLSCGSNYLTTINLTHNPNLTDLNCADNYLTTLDLTNNPKLDYLECRNNKFTFLDLSHNPSLEILRCNNNPLTTLDLSRNSKLLRNGKVCVDDGVQVQKTPQRAAEKPSFASKGSGGVG